MDPIKSIRKKQQERAGSQAATQPPEHHPEMLYIGCIDARLDPIDDIGIGKGKALIFRNPAALVLPHRPDKDATPRNLGVGASLEFFLTRFPHESGKVRHVVVSGHTDCGGLKACQHGKFGKDDYYLPIYMESLQVVRDNVMAKAKKEGWDDAKILQELEKGSVRQSIANLLTYPMVAQAMKEGKLQIHGWVIDTATQRISEMDNNTLEFHPMG